MAAARHRQRLASPEGCLESLPTLSPELAARFAREACAGCQETDLPEDVVTVDAGAAPFDPEDVSDLGFDEPEMEDDLEDNARLFADLL